MSGLGARGHIDEARIESLHDEGFGDTPLQFAQQVPNGALLLDVEIVERGHMTARRDHDVTGGFGVGVGDGDRVLVDDPSVVYSRGAI